MKTQLNYVRSKVTVRPQLTEIEKAVERAQQIKLTESARMQFPKTENY